MGLLNLFNYAIKNMTKYEGRACRKEYFAFTLGAIVLSLIFIVLTTITAAAFGKDESPVGGLLALLIVLAFSVISIVLFIASLSLNCRRLHDLNLSGWYQVLSYVPIVNAIAGLVFFVMFFFIHGTEGENQYGPESENY